MKLGVPMEPAGETRVAIAPSSMKKLLKAGFEVFIEKVQERTLIILMQITNRQEPNWQPEMKCYHVKQ